MIFVLSCMAGRRVLVAITAALIFWSIWRITTQGDPGGPWADDLLRRGMLGFFLGQTMWHGRRWLKFVPSPVLIFAMLAGIWFQTGQYSPLLPLTLVTWPAALLLSLRLRAMENPAMIWLGDRSYAIYLINLPLVMMVASLVNPKALGIFQILIWQMGMFMAVLLLSDASYRWLERPSRAAIRQAWENERRRITLIGPAVS